MQNRMKVADVELTAPAESTEALHDYGAVKALVRLRGIPMGYTEVPVRNGRCSAMALRKAILDQHGRKIVERLVQENIASGCPQTLRIQDLFDLKSSEETALPSVTVAICTRNRVLDLARCLDSLASLDVRPLEILVVDNAPSSDSTEKLVRTSYPHVRYACEPRPGLNWARNRAIMEARGEIIAFTDDDVFVDPGWLTSLVRVFAENPDAMAVTGLVVPWELETKAQLFFESSGGCARGFTRQWVNRKAGSEKRYHQAWRFGSGANMAYRRRLFDEIGFFDAALDVGTVANGGGDLEMFFRLLKEGHTLVYEPSAIVRHRHRRSYEQLRTQLANTGVGYFSYLVRSALAYPEELAGFLRAGLDRMLRWNLKRFLLSFVSPLPVPRDLIFVELVGSFVGLGRYPKARSVAMRIANTMGGPIRAFKKRQNTAQQHQRQPKAIAVRTIELSQGLQPLADLTDYERVRLHVTWKDRFLGDVEIAHRGMRLSVTRLSEAIVGQLGLKLLDPSAGENPDDTWTKAAAELANRFLPKEPHRIQAHCERLPDDVPVSVVVVAGNRPEALRCCLGSLAAQESRRPVEIVVVNTNPDAQAIAGVTAQFPNGIVVNEQRPGLAYARNAGLIASSGAVVVTTDESISMPSHWLETLLAPFVQPGVMAVTGNVLSREIESKAQQQFDKLGVLGRGSEAIQADSAWFSQFRFSGVPAWVLGTGANAAFRASILSDPQIGLLEESLGQGPPHGCEESYLFYQILHAGYKIVYQPSAFAWHTPPSDAASVRRFVYRHAQAQIAYYFTTLIRDRDFGSLMELAFHLPGRWGARLLGRIGKQHNVPFSLIGLELAGLLTGPWALVKSIRTVNRQGRSGFYIPVSQRKPDTWSDLFLDARLRPARSS